MTSILSKTSAFRTLLLSRHLLGTSKQPSLRSANSSYTSPSRHISGSAAMTSSTGGIELGRLKAEETALFVCDVQERFRSVISGYTAVVDVARRMSRAAKELCLPVIVTEQYPKALGPTVPEVHEVLPEENSIIVAKTDFSMLVPEVDQKLGELHHVRNIVLVGIETHVCVFQTTLDLIERGYKVHILVDGVSSRNITDRAAAIQRLAQAGAFIATSEMTLFQMMVNTAHPSFKAISALCKEERPEQLPPI